MPDTADQSRQDNHRRRRRPSISNEQFLERALELFVESGFEGTSIDAITADAGIAKRTIYSRYGDKKSLYKAALHHEIKQWSETLDGVRDAETEDLEQSLVHIGQALLDKVLSPQGLRLLQLTGSVARRMPEIGAHNVEQGTAPILSFLTDLFSRRLGERLHSFFGPADAAMAFMNLVVAGPANMVAQGMPLEDQFKDHYVKSSVCLFLRGAQSSGDDRTFVALQDENLRLKKLLAEAMIELHIARQGPVGLKLPSGQ
jgi:AcrR family transcriptional regulator